MGIRRPLVSRVDIDSSLASKTEVCAGGTSKARGSMENEQRAMPYHLISNVIPPSDSNSFAFVIILRSDVGEGIAFRGRSIDGLKLL